MNKYTNLYEDSSSFCRVILMVQSHTCIARFKYSASLACSVAVLLTGLSWSDDSVMTFVCLQQTNN